MRLLPILAITLCAASATAQPKDNKAESDRAFNDGLIAIDSKDYIAARAKFAEAYSKYPSPNSLLNLANTEQLLGQCTDASSHFRAYLALPDNPRITADKKETARQGIVACASKVARVNVKAPPGTTISVDGNSVKWIEGDPIELPPGTHVVELKNGSEARTRKVACMVGTVAYAEWDDPVVQGPQTDHSANHPNDNTPPPILPPDQVTEPNWTGKKKMTVISLAALGVGALIAAPILGVTSNAAAADADGLSQSLRAVGGTSACTIAPSSTCTALADKRSSATSLATASRVLWVAGPVLAVAAVVAVLVWPNTKHVVTPTANGVAFSF